MVLSKSAPAHGTPIIATIQQEMDLNNWFHCVFELIIQSFTASKNNGHLLLWEIPNPIPVAPIKCFDWFVWCFSISRAHSPLGHFATVPSAVHLFPLHTSFHEASLWLQWTVTVLKSQSSCSNQPQAGGSGNEQPTAMKRCTNKI